MLARERQKQILEMFKDQRIIKTSDIAEKYGISNLTARRDLDVLSEQGLVRRIYGGAFLIPKTVPDPVIEEETQRKKDIEIRITEAIGKLAATMVEEGDMVYLGNGLQTLEVAKNLVKIPNLTYITGSMMIANFLMNSNCMTYILGGLIDPYEQNIYTRSAMSMMENFYPDKAFLGCNGITLKHGVTAYNLPGAELGTISVQSSAKTIIVAQSWKFGTDARNKVCNLSDVYAIVTDDNLPPEHRESFGKAGVPIYFAETTEAQMSEIEDISEDEAEN